LTKFPVDYLTTNRCRHAWKRGAEVSRFVKFRINVKTVNTADPVGAQAFQELLYEVVDTGRDIGRVDSEHFALASAFGYAINQELFDGLKDALDKESDEVLKWILAQTRDKEQEEEIDPGDISSMEMWITDPSKVNAFTVFQAFIMGYYYGLFLSLVDTSKLNTKSIDGAWGFRDTSFLSIMRNGLKLLRNTDMCMQRTSIIMILSKLLMSHRDGLSNNTQARKSGYRQLLGVVGNDG
jgi:hypothetical protein